MGRPGGSGNQVAVPMSIVHRNFHVFTAGTSNIGADRRIGAATFPFQDTRGCKHLSPVADGCNRFIGLAEMSDDP